MPNGPGPLCPAVPGLTAYPLSIGLILRPYLLGILRAVSVPGKNASSRKSPLLLAMPFSSDDLSALGHVLCHRVSQALHGSWPLDERLESMAEVWVCNLQVTRSL